MFAALDALTNGNLAVVFNGDYVSPNLQDRLAQVLGDRAVALRGEWRVGANSFSDHMANRAFRIPWQRGLLSAVRRSKPSVIVSDGFFQWTPPALWMRARYGIPHVMCYERTAHTERNAQWYRRIYRKGAMRYIDAYCCSGQLCGEYVQSLGVRPDRITYGHMVADVEGFSVAASRVAEKGAALRAEHRLQGTVFIAVGRLVRRKGVYELLATWKQFKGKKGNEDATLVLVGDGPERDHMEAICRDSGLLSVRFVGRVEHRELASYYAASDVLVMPTREDNWSLVVPEAMACGLPVLCSCRNGCWPELVEDGSTGWVFDPLSADAFVAVLSRALNARHRLRAMGAAASNRVLRHTPAQAAKSILRACSIALGDTCQREIWAE